MPPPPQLSQQLPSHSQSPIDYWGLGNKPPPISPAAADAVRRFIPQPHPAVPYDLFAVHLNGCTVSNHRFLRKTNKKQMLMFFDGACSKNGAADARGGCGVIYTTSYEAPGVSLPLERDGITHTSNRAELRAALLAMGLRHWPGEGFDNVVLASDSDYVVSGVSQWLLNWEINGWKTATGKDVKNRDLWEMMRKELRRWEKKGVLVQFWLIPRALNEADRVAKDATTQTGYQGPVMCQELIVVMSPPGLLGGHRRYGEDAKRYGQEPDEDGVYSD